MVNFNLEGLENLGGIEGFEKIFNGNFGGALATLGALAIFIAIIFIVIAVFCYVLGSIGLMNLAKKNNIPNSWLSFLPIGRSYIIGKLGYEIYDKENKNAITFMWITLGLGAAAFVLVDSNGDLSTLIRYGLLFFETYAFYNIFKNLNPKNATIYTIIIAIVGLLLKGSTLLGGLILYFMKQPNELGNEKIENATIVSETKEEKDEIKKGTKKTANKGNFCPNCGTKLTKDAKFCPECGKKIN